MQNVRLSKFYITSFTEDHFISALISMRDYGFGFQAHLTDKHSLTEQANWVFVELFPWDADSTLLDEG